jgi:hypothetical protein
MARAPIDDHEMAARRLASQSLIRITVVVLGAHAIGGAIAVGVAAIVWPLPARRLLVPYLLLLVCGSTLSSLLLWAQPARARPQAYAMRVALSIGAYLVNLTLALGCSAIWLGILSEGDALTRFLPLVNVAAAVSITLYFVLRRVFARGKARSDIAPGPRP